MNERQETGAQQEQRLQGEAMAAEIARKRAEGEPLTEEEQASADVQADKDAAAEEQARQDALAGDGTPDNEAEADEAEDPNVDPDQSGTPPAADSPQGNGSQAAQG